MKGLALAFVAGLLGAVAAAAAPAKPVDAGALQKAKTLYFDRQYAPAREAWRAVHAAGGDEAALYWIARCSEALGEHERALGEYARYLDARPSDRALAEEARTSRVGLATRLYKAGRPEHLDVLLRSLEDPSRTVRYFAALQLSGLPREVSRPAVPVLKRILADETDDDLVERAKIALLRVDARALPSVEVARTRPHPRGEPVWIRVRIFAPHRSEPQVSIDLPLGLAELVFKSLPDDARRELNGRGFEAQSFLRKLKELGPAQVLDVQGEGGEKVQVWIE
jgi:hypothetical protein